MMIDGLTDEYKRLYGSWRKYIKLINKRHKIIVIGLTAACIIFAYLLPRNNYTLLFALVPMIPTLVYMTKFFPDEKLKIIKSFNYNSVEEYNNGLYLTFLEKLKEYNINIHDSIQLEKLLEVIKERLEDTKPKFLSTNNITVTFLISVWIAFIRSLYDQGQNIQDLVGFTIMITVLCMYIFGLSMIIKPIPEDIVYMEYKNLKRMYELIQDIYIKSYNKQKIILLDGNSNKLM